MAPGTLCDSVIFESFKIHKATWRKALEDFRSQVRFNPESIQGMVFRMMPRVFPQLGWQSVCRLPQLEWRQVELELQLA